MKSLSLCLTVLATLSLPSPARAELITFDDLPPSDGLNLPNGYAGLNWQHMAYIDPTIGPSGQVISLATSGYAHGIVSPGSTAFNGGGAQATISAISGTFALVSGYFTAAWMNGLNLNVTAYDGGTTVLNANYTLEITGPVLLTFDLPEVTKVDFTSSGGTQVYWYGNGPAFVMDNLTVDLAPAAAPEPGQMVAALVLGGLGLVARRWGRSQ